ncbi:citrate lyase holo-[acyl-carrier protein] synthase [Schnuerera sp. xch1]|uniref:citrate lyase holo-[acyl-carrier protein] synthase n=1 Tax=Schnuerera sp. xch1 TaxID=2874283 RepID=UPI001CBF59EF|nr:citrate lyase holo-[acyl-carrier protein] synthase [Schnuerera sp. xch1]MBZ2174030.1 citrate lyase holo-[acyl-carrier protein] synthase [Schnuerera sp. xch1]
MIDNIFKAREERYKYILKLIERYRLPIICGKINYPGANKNTSAADKIFNMLLDKLYGEFRESIIFSRLLEGYDGKSLIIIVNVDQLTAKKRVVKIEEENRIGRLYDIDVYSLRGISLSRKELGLQPRKCIICNENPWICRKLNKHKLSELLTEIDNILKDK